MVKVIYRDQTEALFDSDEFVFVRETSIFKIPVGKHYVMIPMKEVRCIGAGKIYVRGNGKEFVYE